MSSTQTMTTTIAITSSDVRAVMTQVIVEVNRLCQLSAYVEVDHDIAELLGPLAMLALADALEAICLQFHVEGMLVREYRYELSPHSVGASGPSPTQSPLPRALPPGTRVRVAVEPNQAMGMEYCRRAFARVGWAPVSEIHSDGPTETEHYGSFGSSGFGVNRHLVRNTRRDLG